MVLGSRGRTHLEGGEGCRAQRREGAWQQGGSLTVQEVRGDVVGHQHVRRQQLVDVAVFSLREEIQDVLIHHIWLRQQVWNTLVVMVSSGSGFDPPVCGPVCLSIYHLSSCLLTTYCINDNAYRLGLHIEDDHIKKLKAFKLLGVWDGKLWHILLLLSEQIGLTGRCPIKDETLSET